MHFPVWISSLTNKLLYILMSRFKTENCTILTSLIHQQVSHFKTCVCVNLFSQKKWIIIKSVSKKGLIFLGFRTDKLQNWKFNLFMLRFMIDSRFSKHNIKITSIVCLKKLTRSRFVQTMYQCRRFYFGETDVNTYLLVNITYYNEVSTGIHAIINNDIETNVSFSVAILSNNEKGLRKSKFSFVRYLI